METVKRSLIKTLTWRFVAILITMIAVYMYNKNFKESVMVSLMANGVKMVLYYLHERMWNHINFGRLRPDYEI